jgi:hypothetical protein
MHDRHGSILRAAFGVIFLGSPLRTGTKLTTTGQLFTMFKGMLSEKPSSNVMKDLTTNTGMLGKLLDNFATIANNDRCRLQLRCFYETKITKKLGIQDFVSISATHTGKTIR